MDPPVLVTGVTDTSNTVGASTSAGMSFGDSIIYRRLSGGPPGDLLGPPPDLPGRAHGEAPAVACQRCGRPLKIGGSGRGQPAKYLQRRLPG